METWNGSEAWKEKRALMSFVTCPVTQLASCPWAQRRMLYSQLVCVELGLVTNETQEVRQICSFQKGVYVANGRISKSNNSDEKGFSTAVGLRLHHSEPSKRNVFGELSARQGDEGK